MSTQKSLADEIERIDGNVNGLFAKVSELADRVEDLEEELAEEKRKRKAAESVAETALGIANQLDEGARADGAPSKKERAGLLSRNELVRQAATTNGKASISYGVNGFRATWTGSIPMFRKILSILCSRV